MFIRKFLYFCTPKKPQTQNSNKMYAIVDLVGQQMKVEKGQEVFVHRLEKEEGKKVEFDNVLLIENEKGKIKVGTPNISGAKVTAKVLEHLKGDKVIVFKKKRRKGYKTKNGHRQYLTKIQIETISTGEKKVKKVVAEAPKTENKTKEKPLEK